MTRPAFQFYTGDWRKNAKLRRCSPAARGVWIDILCLLHDAEEYGVLRWPLKDIIRAAGASTAHVKELVEKGVFKGADKDAEAYVYRPTHAGKQGDPVILVTADGGPVWYCSRFVRDELVRQRRGSTTRFDSTNQPSNRSPKGGIGERLGDGPSSSSSSSYSATNVAAGQAVDNSVDESAAGRKLWSDAGAWLVANGLDTGDAKAFMNTIAQDWPTVAADAFREALKTEKPHSARAFVTGIAKNLHAQRHQPKTVPSDAAERTAEEQAQRLDAGSEAGRQAFAARHLGSKREGLAA